jgi:hypothetical protein
MDGVIPLIMPRRGQSKVLVAAMKEVQQQRRSHHQSTKKSNQVER